MTCNEIEEIESLGLLVLAVGIEDETCNLVWMTGTISDLRWLFILRLTQLSQLSEHAECLMKPDYVSYRVLIFHARGR